MPPTVRSQLSVMMFLQYFDSPDPSVVSHGTSVGMPPTVRSQLSQRLADVCVWGAW